MGYTQDPEGTTIYDHVHKKRCEEMGPSSAGLHAPLFCLVCAYVFAEGLFILLRDKPSLGLHGPFAQSETGFLNIVGWGDVITAVLGLIGIWFSQNLLPIGWRQLSRVHSTIAYYGAGTLLIWRTLVCLSIAPWAGIALAFSPPQTDKVWMYILVCAYFALSILLVYILMMGFRQIVSDSYYFQEHLDRQALEERKQLLRNAAEGPVYDEGGRSIEVTPEVFGLCDLATGVMLYACILAVACIWSFFHLILSGHTAGGWAFFTYTPVVSTTFWWEAILYPIAFAGAVIGLAAAAAFSETTFVLGEDQSRKSLLIFFLSCVFRFGLLFAITGMTLLEKNTCGFYLHGLASIAYRSPFSSTAIGIHCVPNEWLLLLGVLVVFSLDGYLTWATYKLYHLSHSWKIEKRKRQEITL